MKIRENNKIYVQGKDLNFIYKNNILLPSTVFMLMEKNKIFNNNKLDEEFIEFSRIDEIFYFENADYIVDYNEYTSKSKLELNNEEKIITNDIVKIKMEFSKYGKKRLDLYYDFKKQEYKFNQVHELYIQNEKAKQISLKK